MFGKRKNGRVGRSGFDCRGARGRGCRGGDPRTAAACGQLLLECFLWQLDNPGKLDLDDVPTSSDTAYINGGSATVSTGNATCYVLSLGSGTGNGNVQMTGGNFSNGFYEAVGDYGTGTFTQSAGANVTYYLDIGNNVGGNGTYGLYAGILVRELL